MDGFVSNEWSRLRFFPEDDIAAAAATPIGPKETKSTWLFKPMLNWDLSIHQTLWKLNLLDYKFPAFLMKKQPTVKEFLLTL